MHEKIILGIDPGSVIMGFGILQESSKNSDIKLVKYGVFELHKHKDHMVRMRYIYLHMMALLETYAPNEVAIESIFYGVNVQSMLKLGRAQGVAIAAALACAIPVAEYAPRKVKQAVTGNGNASKEQVSSMVSRILKISTPSAFLDASDALAVALCHSQQRLSSVHVKPKSWAQFIADHLHCKISAS